MFQILPWSVSLTAAQIALQPTFQQAVSRQEPMWLVQSGSSLITWVKAQPPGAPQRAPPPGMADEGLVIHFQTRGFALIKQHGPKKVKYRSHYSTL